MALGIIFGIVLISIGACVVYGAIMIFFPEWVGITGKTALEYQKSHVEGSTVDPSEELVDRIQKPTRGSTGKFT